MFKYNWKLAEDYPKEKHNKTVFSTFACGGGSTMGYKLAGFKVLGANDIDPKMAKIYQTNHKPELYYLGDIRDLLTQELDPRLFDLDIFDGSPPCTTFSMAGKREKSWGVERDYAEGATRQTLDDLYFRYIEVADKLRPKVIVTENVAGMAKGKAINYLKAVMSRMREIGYQPQAFILNGATMGCPQRRERVFVIAQRNDLKKPKLILDFKEKPIPFGEFRSPIGKEPTEHNKALFHYYKKGDKCISDLAERVAGKLSGFSHMIVDDDDIYPTIVAAGVNYRAFDKMEYSDSDYITAGSFPQDYDFCESKPKYVVGMSVPPVMMAQVAKQIYEQWLK